MWLQLSGEITIFKAHTNVCFFVYCSCIACIAVCLYCISTVLRRIKLLKILVFSRLRLEFSPHSMSTLCDIGT